MSETSESGISSDEEMELIKNEEPIEVLQKTYEEILISLDQARFCLFINKNITLSQLCNNTREAMEHMEVIKKLAQEEIEKPNASARTVAQEMINTASEVTKKQHCLNNHVINCQEESLNDIIDTLNTNIKSINISESKRRKKIDIQKNLEIIDGNWILYFFTALVFANLWILTFPLFAEDK
ncbi:uncharacterized protein TNCV_941051 [Trichonephila clavipes]|nr:uncharacterized protein TNCV_941051 [Trichonephila clavipes]